MSYQSVNILLLEAAIMDTMRILTYNPRRIDLRWSCIMACKSLLDTFLAVPHSDYHAIPNSSLCHVSFSLMILFKVSFLEDPGWDLNHVRETIQLESYFNHFVSMHQSVQICFLDLLLHVELGYNGLLRFKHEPGLCSKI